MSTKETMSTDENLGFKELITNLVPCFPSVICALIGKYAKQLLLSYDCDRDIHTIETDYTRRCLTCITDPTTIERKEDEEEEEEEKLPPGCIRISISRRHDDEDASSCGSKMRALLKISCTTIYLSTSYQQIAVYTDSTLCICNDDYKFLVVDWRRGQVLREFPLPFSPQKGFLNFGSVFTDGRRAHCISYRISDTDETSVRTTVTSIDDIYTSSEWTMSQPPCILTLPRESVISTFFLPDSGIPFFLELDSNTVYSFCSTGWVEAELPREFAFLYVEAKVVVPRGFLSCDVRPNGAFGCSTSAHSLLIFCKNCNDEDEYEENERYHLYEYVPPPFGADGKGELCELPVDPINFLPENLYFNYAEGKLYYLSHSEDRNRGEYIFSLSFVKNDGKVRMQEHAPICANISRLIPDTPCISPLANFAATENAKNSRKRSGSNGLFVNAEIRKRGRSGEEEEKLKSEAVNQREDVENESYQSFEKRTLEDALLECESFINFPFALVALVAEYGASPFGLFFLVKTKTKSRLGFLNLDSAQIVTLSENFTLPHSTRPARLGHDLYLVGGADNQSRTVRYNIPSRTWASLPVTHAEQSRFETPLHSHTVVPVRDDKIVLVCGEHEYGYEDCISHVYVAASDEWECARTVRQNRKGAAFAHLENKIYLFGGTKDNSGLLTCEAYDLDIQEWEQIAPLPVALLSASAVVVGRDIILVSGGLQKIDQSEAEKTVYEYRPSTDTWSMRHDLALPRPLFGHLSVYNPRTRCLYIVHPYEHQMYCLYLDIAPVVWTQTALPATIKDATFCL